MIISTRQNSYTVYGISQNPDAKILQYANDETVVLFSQGFIILVLLSVGSVTDGNPVEKREAVPEAGYYKRDPSAVADSHDYKREAQDDDDGTVLTINLKDELSKNVGISPQHSHSLNIFYEPEKRETNPLNFIPSRTSPFRKRFEHEKNSKNSRRRRIIRKRNPAQNLDSSILKKKLNHEKKKK
ncbi:hypothetical protein RCL_jg25673.t1 [Rhizophagus clarus]|uniref:Uncharacterized protein n=1 Tax=Rhizophagus clarus TaxID=94130 RepID=A0A8H3L0H9_9GLOM|nr:hypothetical protein RCL_jg25673.t1 [Rhizophagus clarus]